MAARKRTQRRAKHDALTERRARAMNLRADGLTYPEIARRMRVSLGTAHNYVQHELDKVRAEAREGAKEQLALELARLDAATKLVMEEIRDGNLAAVDRLTKLNERRSKLLGLERTMVELSGPGGGPVEVVTPTAARDLMQAEFGSVGADLGGESDGDAADSADPQGAEESAGDGPARAQGD